MRKRKLETPQCKLRGFVFLETETGISGAGESVQVVLNGWAWVGLSGLKFFFLLDCSFDSLFGTLEHVQTFQKDAPFEKFRKHPPSTWQWELEFEKTTYLKTKEKKTSYRVTNKKESVLQFLRKHHLLYSIEQMNVPDTEQPFDPVSFSLYIRYCPILNVFLSLDDDHMVLVELPFRSTSEDLLSYYCTHYNSEKVPIEQLFVHDEEEEEDQHPYLRPDGIYSIQQQEQRQQRQHTEI